MENVKELSEKEQLGLTEQDFNGLSGVLSCLAEEFGNLASEEEKYLASVQKHLKELWGASSASEKSIVALVLKKAEKEVQLRAKVGKFPKECGLHLAIDEVKSWGKGDKDYAKAEEAFKDSWDWGRMASHIQMVGHCVDSARTACTEVSVAPHFQTCVSPCSSTVPLSRMRHLAAHDRSRGSSSHLIRRCRRAGRAALCES